ncbi:MAG: hypothetical protein KDC84_10335 [Crocinitomicaceae bacterium]|nr:hypothetical protein [Crocinitomicaceae bacterium]
MKNSFVLILISVSLFSCISDNKTEKKDAQKEVKETTTEDTEVESKAEALRLDDGKKWVVNPETTKGVRSMTQRITNFDLTSNSEKYQELFDSLDSDFRYIFKECTTEGVAHDQLHIMLFPLRGMFNRLKSPEEKIRKEAVGEIKTQLGLYENYFTS